MMTLKNELKKLGLMLAIFCITSCGEEGGGAGSTNTGSSGNTSVSGSTAAMTIYQNTIYFTDSSYVQILDLETKTVIKSLQTPLKIETLYVYQHYLYAAGTTGVAVFDIEDPLNPIEVSTLTHARGCDPIIVSEDIGYVTLRSRFKCTGISNELQIYDFSAPTLPEKLGEFKMKFPYGLTKTPNYLAVCEGDFGLTLLDVTQPDAVKEITNYPQYQCFDLIYNNQTLIVTAANGIYQLDATDEFLGEISRIPVGAITTASGSM